MKNVKLPVGMPPPGGAADTVAVNVTGWPNTDGLVDGVNVISDRACFTSCVRGPADADLNVASPGYVTLSVCEPTLSVETIKVATPEALNGRAIKAPSTSKVTLPLGVLAEPDSAVASAENVTDSPNS